MVYRVTIDDQSWLTDELTLDEACRIEEQTGATWRAMEPVYSAALARAIFVTLLARGGDTRKAKDRVGAMTVDEALSCVTLPDEAAVWEGRAGTYRVTIDDNSWITEELTLDEACVVEEETGTTWLALQPVNSAKHARSILRLFLARVHGINAAKMRVDTMSIADTRACITEIKPASKAAGESPKAERETTLESSPPIETPPES